MTSKATKWARQGSEARKRNRVINALMTRDGEQRTDAQAAEITGTTIGYVRHVRQQWCPWLDGSASR